MSKKYLSSTLREKYIKKFWFFLHVYYDFFNKNAEDELTHHRKQKDVYKLICRKMDFTSYRNVSENIFFSKDNSHSKCTVR